MPKKPKQEDLPAIEGEGVAQVRHKDLDKAANAYVEKRDSRQVMLQEEIGAKAVLLAKMEEKGLTVYRFDDHQVELVPGKAKIKVKTVGADGGDEDEEDQD